MSSIVGTLASLNIVYGFIKAVLEVVFYVLAIVLSLKGIKAINVYLYKNSK